MAQDTELRERIRRNVGHPHRPVTIHAPAALGGLATIIPTKPPPGVDAPPPAFIYRGHSYALTAQTPLGTREIKVTPRIGFKFQLRQVAIMGTWAITDAISVRVLISDDDDTTAVADPTGVDVVQFSGDVVGAADPGLFIGPNVGPLLIEPWTLIEQTGKFIKVKMHNAAGAAANWVAFLDLDELA